MEATAVQNTESSLADLFAGSEEDTQAIVVARAKAYLDARRLKEEQEQTLKDTSKRLQDAETELLRAMDGASVKSLKIDHEGATAALSQTASTYYSLPAGAVDDPEMVAWITEHGGMDIIKNTIHHATFSSFCKEIREQTLTGGGEGVLHPAIKIVERRGIMLRKG